MSESAFEATAQELHQPTVERLRAGITALKTDEAQRKAKAEADLENREAGYIEMGRREAEAWVRSARPEDVSRAAKAYINNKEAMKQADARNKPKPLRLENDPYFAHYFKGMLRRCLIPEELGTTTQAWVERGWWQVAMDYYEAATN